MKFRNGRWLTKKGAHSFSPKTVYETSVTDGTAKLFAPSFYVGHRGDTLGGVCFTFEISAPLRDTLRVRVYHHKGRANVDADKNGSFTLNIADGILDAEDTMHHLTVRSGALELKIDKSDCSMRFYRGGKLLTSSTGDDMSYIVEDWRGDAYRSGTAYMCQRLALDVDELIYGLGERFTPIVRNGQSVEIWNEDGGTSTEQSYKNVPFFLSNRGYGVFVDHPERVDFEIATETVNRTAFSVEGECLDYFIFCGDTMKDVICRYTDLTGKPALPPRWSFGLWLSTSFTTNYDEDTVMSFIDGMFDRGIPLSVFHFDCCWMKPFHWTDFMWDSDVFPDPEGMIRRIHERGVRVCVWINPYIAQQSALFDEGMKNGYFLRRADGSVWQWDMWQPGMAIVDFTNPDAVRWYGEGLERLFDMGVDCFKTDFGERIPTDAAYYNGADPKKMHNLYSYLYNGCVHDVLAKRRGEDDAVLFARSATAGCQKFPVHWGGDCWSDYGGMEQSIRGGLSLTCSGFSFWSHDIGGFESSATPDLYKRWCAFGLLSTHSRLHGSTAYKVPWLYGDEAVHVLRFFTDLKHELMPYLWSEAKRSSTSGVPMMRMMALEFENDYNCRYLDKQYMLGESLLVAPIFNAEGIAHYYLPRGKWTNFFTGDVVEGGVWREERVDYLSIPLYVRENSVIPVGISHPNAEYRFDGNVELRVFGLTGRASTEVYDGGDVIMTASFDREQNCFTVDGGDGCRIRIDGVVIELTKDHESGILKK